MSAHLKPEQFNDLLLGIAAEEITAHLGACPQCRAEIEGMRQALASFRSASTRWSEGAATQVTPPDKHPTRPVWTRPAWVLASVAILLAVAISFSVRRGRGNASIATTEAQAQIARDNQLLADIQSRIGETTPAPLQPLQVSH